MAERDMTAVLAAVDAELAQPNGTVGEIPTHLRDRRSPVIRPRVVPAPTDYAPPRVRAAAEMAAPLTEVAARDRHFRAADAIENDAQTLQQHGIDMSKRLEEGLAQVEAAMVRALKESEQKCAATRAGLVAASDAHNANVAEYLTICTQHADQFRTAGEQLLDYIKRADAVLVAKRDAILLAGEDKPEQTAAAGDQSGG
jgi:hypothetical protein